jgi:serine/threonine protein phosphatase 1
MGRTLAIGDIHGCRLALETLLGQIGLRPTDTLITVGDAIDRGPDSYGVLETLIRLRLAGNVVNLRGNHEIMMLAARADRESLRFWMQVGGREALDSYPASDGYLMDRIPQSHWHYLTHSCVNFHETDTHIFVHANLHPLLPLQEQSDEWLHWNFLEPNLFRPHISGKTMICGHSEQRSGIPLVLPGAVCIDTWAYGDGWLTCLDVDTGHYLQANDAGQTREGILGRNSG